MNYCWSKYNINEKFDGFYAIFNTKSSALIKIDDNSFKRINSSLNNNRDFHKLNEFEILIDNGF